MLCYPWVSAQEFWLNSNSYLGKPFYELIDFSDCEGVLGPQACYKLSKDFNIENRWKFIYYLKNGESITKLESEEAWELLGDIAKLGYDDQQEENGFLSLYDDFMNAFESAAGTGALMFC